MTMNDTNELRTVGQIAANLGVPLHRVTWIIDRRNVAPKARVANLRLFDAGDEAYIARELNRIAAERAPASI